MSDAVQQPNENQCTHGQANPNASHHDPAIDAICTTVSSLEALRRELKPYPPAERYTEAGQAASPSTFVVLFCFPPGLPFDRVSSHDVVACSRTLSRTTVMMLRAAPKVMAVVPGGN